MWRRARAPSSGLRHRSSETVRLFYAHSLLPSAPSFTRASLKGERLSADLGNMSSEPVRLIVGAAQGDVIAVGWDAARALGAQTAALDGLSDDGYRLISNAHGVPPGSLVVSGARGDQRRGTLFAVYDFLRLLGCEFYAPDLSMGEEMPATPIVIPQPLDVRYEPQLEYRDTVQWAASGPLHPLPNGTLGTASAWAGKLGYNGPNAFAAVPAPSRMAVTYAGGFVHTSYALLETCNKSVFKRCGSAPPPDLFRTHPEWFSSMDPTVCECQAPSSSLDPNVSVSPFAFAQSQMASCAGRTRRWLRTSRPE